MTHSAAQILVGNINDTTSFANKLAKSINCTGDGHIIPCESCSSCNAFNGGNHPDTFYVKKTKLTSIGVDNVREQIILPMSTKPFVYKHKVFITPQAEILTPEAQNALLKILEEPADYGFFLFLAPSKHNFLPTILSRCHVVHVPASGGNAQSINTVNTEIVALSHEICDNIHNYNIIQVFNTYPKLKEYDKETLLIFLDALYHAYSNKLANITTTGQKPTASLLSAFSTIGNTKNILMQNGNTQLALELMLLKLSN